MLKEGLQLRYFQMMRIHFFSTNKGGGAQPDS